MRPPPYGDGRRELDQVAGLIRADGKRRAAVRWRLDAARKLAARLRAEAEALTADPDLSAGGRARFAAIRAELEGLEREAATGLEMLE